LNRVVKEKITDYNQEVRKDAKNLDLKKVLKRQGWETAPKRVFYTENANKTKRKPKKKVQRKGKNGDGPCYVTAEG